MNTMTVGFTISGDFITNHSRNLWTEGSYSKALDFLECIDGLTHEQRVDILAGKLKMIGANSTLDLVEDEWKPGEDIDYPPFVEGMRRGDNWHELKELRENAAWKIAYEEWPYYNYSIFDRKRTRYSGILAKIAKHVGEQRAAQIMQTVQNEKMDDWSGRKPPEPLVKTDEEKKESSVLSKSSTLDPIEMLYAQTQNQMMVNAVLAGQDPSSVPTVEAMMNRGSNLKIKLDSKMESANGWLLPNGNYYGCGVMEHVGLAENLMEHLKISVPDSNHERHAEDLGWIKISKSSTGFYIISKKKPTQKQQNKLWDYCQKHNRDYDEYVSRLLL